ncbi:hypothetical protein N9J72_02610 [Candidatus Gracilibacteria bacterium]|nr:hypothetical protein [Candidatus Gracilibacteria bacterium]
MLSFQNIIYIIAILSILSFSGVSAAEENEGTCAYAAQFEQCAVANKNGTALSIEEFRCIQNPDQSRMLDNIILSIKFKEIDTQVELFLEDIRNDKQRIVDNREEVIDDIWYYLDREGYFYNQYQAVCNSGLLTERLSCTQEIPNVVGALYLDGSNYDSRPCMNSVNTKINAYLWVADQILPLATSEYQNDTKQLYRQEERDRYTMLVDLMRAILGFLERLANGITHWTPFPYGS